MDPYEWANNDDTFSWRHCNFQCKSIKSYSIVFLSIVSEMFLPYAGSSKYSIIIVVVVVGYGCIWWKVIVFYSFECIDLCRLYRATNMIVEFLMIEPHKKFCHYLHILFAKYKIPVLCWLVLLWPKVETFMVLVGLLPFF